MLKKYELKNIINQYLSLFNANNESNTSIGNNKSGSINNICKQSSILYTNNNEFILKGKYLKFSKEPIIGQQYHHNKKVC